MSKRKNFSIGNVATSVMSNIAERVETTETKAKNDIREININLIKPSEKNTFGMRDIDKLADSIKEYGQLENEERKKELESEQKEEIEKASREKILELEESLKKLQEEEEKKRTQQEEEIKTLRQKLEEKEKEKKEAKIKEINIIGNMEIKALAEQARKVLTSLTQKIAEYNEKEGFEISEEVQKVLNEISEYENN